jgi:hypothetical protein
MSGSSDLVPPVDPCQPRHESPASDCSGDNASGSGCDNDSESGGDSSPRSMWNYYFEKPHSSQYIPGGKTAAVAVAGNVESFTQNLKTLGRVRQPLTFSPFYFYFFDKLRRCVLTISSNPSMLEHSAGKPAFFAAKAIFHPRIFAATPPIVL